MEAWLEVLIRAADDSLAALAIIAIAFANTRLGGALKGNPAFCQTAFNVTTGAILIVYLIETLRSLIGF